MHCSQALGGFNLGFDWTGQIETKWNVDIERYCHYEMARLYPSTRIYDDIHGVGKHNLGRVDIISGGFPCQDISVAGKGDGLDGERSRLWFEMFRVVRELRPRFVVIENSPALNARGLNRILANLASIRYDAEWNIISAGAVGARHLRERLYIISYPQCQGSQIWEGESASSIQRIEFNDRAKISHSQGERRGKEGKCISGPEAWIARPSKELSNSTGSGLEDSSRLHSIQQGALTKFTPHNYWETEPNLGMLVDGLPIDVAASIDIRSSERDWPIPQVAENIPRRKAKVKGLGNAVVPIIPYILGNRIAEIINKASYIT